MYVFIILYGFWATLTFIYYTLCLVCVSTTKIIFMKSVSFPVAHVLYYNTNSITMSTIILEFYVNYMQRITVPTHSYNIHKTKEK